MALSVSQNWASGTEDEFDANFQVVDSALLMSFLEETQGEECDHDQLLTLMKSLEAEIDDCDPAGLIGIKDRRQTDLVQVDDEWILGCHGQGQDCSTSSESFDFKWMDHMDMEMDMDMDSGNWYMDQLIGCGNININDHDQLIEYGSGSGVRGADYSLIYSAGLNMMGVEEQSYGSLWQES